MLNVGCAIGDANGKPSGIAATVVKSCIGLGCSSWSGVRAEFCLGAIELSGLVRFGIVANRLNRR